MRQFDPQLAEIRFGYGLSPVVSGPRTPEALLQGLRAPDAMQARYPIESFSTFELRMKAAQEQLRIRRKNRGTDIAKAAQKERNLLNKTARQEAARWLGLAMLRRTNSPHAFRERLVAFWGDHFTARGKVGVVRRGTSPYIEDAIRPNITGRFADLLKAAVMHPLMLHYLDQAKAMGPNSTRALKRGKAAGLNENLAREVLELHTLGVGAAYSQEDVRQLAELFTGMSFQAGNGFKFRKDFVEPGAETVLDTIYDDTTNIRPIHAVLDDLAVHPDTARHIAEKLAVHFVADTPDPDLVDQMAAVFAATDGDLMAVYGAMLDHPAAWVTERRNAKPPIDFVSSALRALAVPDMAITSLDEKGIRKTLSLPMAQMGQFWERPEGPDGWPEEDSAWITPQGLTWRVRWAMTVPQALKPELPDPRVFVEVALGRFASDDVRFAAGASESVPEAIGLVLMSPAFQRR